MYDLFDDTAVQVVLAIDPGDSIRRVAQRIQTPYETVRQTVNALEDSGFVRYDAGLYVTDPRVREMACQFLAANARTSPPSIEEAYVVPQFGDREFAFTRVDAVYVWTEGGYQVGRSPDDYPLFVAVRDADIEYWEAFFEQFGLPVALERQPVEAIDGPLQVVLEPRTDFEFDWVEGYPVIPREDAITYMRENFAHFQPALSMLDDMYDDIDLNVAYRESERVSE